MRKLNLIDILFYTSLLSAPLRAYGLFSISGFTVSIFKISSILFFITYLLQLFVTRKNVRLYLVHIVLFALLFSLIFSLFYSNLINLGLFPSYLFSITYIIFSFTYLTNKTLDRLTISKIIVSSSILPILIGIYQWLYYEINSVWIDLPLQQFVFSNADSLLISYDNARISSTLLDPSYFGGFLNSIIILITGMLIHDKIKKSWSLYLFLIFVAFTIIVTGSVSSIISLIFGMSLLFFIYLFFNFKKSFKRILLIISFSMIALIFLDKLGFDFVYTYFFKVQNQYQTYGITYGRNLFFQEALLQFENNPIFGIGFGNLSFTSAHNSLLTILVQQGSIVFALYLIVLVIIPIHSFLIGIKRRDYILISFSIAYFTLLLQSMVYDIIFKADYTSVLVVLALVPAFLKRKALYE